MGSFKMRVYHRGRFAMENGWMKYIDGEKTVIEKLDSDRWFVFDTNLSLPYSSAAQPPLSLSSSIHVALHCSATGAPCSHHSSVCPAIEYSHCVVSLPFSRRVVASCSRPTTSVSPSFQAQLLFLPV
ncbi:hypothetical protein PIB30_051196 [Stylosanthes scabra]|uniref:PB1-like domain-containing protein n=1 Tax=Stylosanthes scabra TaxID=79078 RepID=A0ABU6XIC8_9FABA|nr:hypothetical protein [Stylosanthes scabra]